MVINMYYKILKNEEVVDVLNNIIYVKYQQKHDILLMCDKTEAQAILSSDGSCAWHINGLYNYPLDSFTYDMEETTKEEYDKHFSDK